MALRQELAGTLGEPPYLPEDAVRIGGQVLTFINATQIAADQIRAIDQRAADDFSRLADDLRRLF